MVALLLANLVCEDEFATANSSCQTVKRGEKVFTEKKKRISCFHTKNLHKHETTVQTQFGGSWFNDVLLGDLVFVYCKV